ncbi:hypothetical protein [Roseovarius sp. D22-M7]|uniref:hypothetical protein n=1 Tax=Roseovarius sp. D22-M7 TaxID=3127116 RepID=UPI003010013D
MLPGQARDLLGTAALITGPNCGQLPADRAFDANWLRGALIEAVIPPKSNRRFPAGFDSDTCKWRHLVKTFLGIFEAYREIGKQCSKADYRYSAFSAIAEGVIPPDLITRDDLIVKSSTLFVPSIFRFIPRQREGFRVPMPREGRPATISPVSTSCVTTDPPAITAPYLMCTPARMLAPAPIQTSFPITMSAASLRCA